MALLVLQAALAAVFLIAGAAKLADPEGSRAAVRGFGVPERLAVPVALGLPGAELLTGLALLVPAAARVGAVAGLVLLLVFAGAITLAMWRGEAPSCHCFGRLHAAPAGRGTLTRNAVLAAAAAVVAVAGPASWGHPSDAVVVGLAAGAVLLALLAAGAWFGFELLRLNGQLLVRIEVLEAGGLRLERLDDGASVVLEELQPAGTPLLLVFSDPGCGPCTALMPEVGRWQRERDDVEVVLVSRGAAAAVAAHSREHGLTQVVLDPDGRAADRYEVNGTPSAVLLGVDGTVAGGPVAGAAAIRELLGPAPSPGPALEVEVTRVGTPAPSFALPGLDGPVTSEALLGEDTLLVFWNPSCGFCAGMLDALKALEAAGTRMVVLSTEDVEPNRAMGLRSPVALDDGFTVGLAYGAPGTPSAVVLGADGRIASGVATGERELLALAATLPVAVG